MIRNNLEEIQKIIGDESSVKARIFFLYILTSSSKYKLARNLLSFFFLESEDDMTQFLALKECFLYFFFTLYLISISI